MVLYLACNQKGRHNILEISKDQLNVNSYKFHIVSSQLPARNSSQSLRFNCKKNRG